ncbi:hypothetical protein M422DRAFT_270176 [Sphaerobolus stellatus SS14]|uniref:Uncharacterized protein n=1 Tax=Sphaerobolus stellatus (strain SS14) TaxID=990650 RepID=A0A0C9UTK1_SPHS4|nr:hypothetical protein M422DRAFT_270176 [Sphaerobolus stellatus SS14]
MKDFSFIVTGSASQVNPTVKVWTAKREVQNNGIYQHSLAAVLFCVVFLVLVGAGLVHLKVMTIPTSSTDPLKNAHPILVLSMLGALLLNLLGGLHHRYSNFVLRMHQLLLALAFTSSYTVAPNQLQAELLKHHPIDIRTAREKFHLEGNIIICAACVRCSCLYPSPYPKLCTHNPFPKDPRSKVCGQTLIHTLPGASTSSPIRPFSFCDPKDWIAQFLSRPGMEELLDGAWERPPNDLAEDIFDGSYIREELGPQTRLYRIQRKGGFYLFALSVDWYNPLQNKQSWENMFLAGVIPGPREPSMEEVDHYITVIIESFLELWDPGVYLTKTAKYPSGRVIRCALVPFVADMKGVRKTAGTKQCGLCATTHAQVVSGAFLDPKEFIRITIDEYRQKAQHWHNAETITERKSL